MNNSPILRSAALQKALALVPVRRNVDLASFSSTLSQTSQRSSASHGAARAAASGDTSLASGSVPFKDLITAAAQKYGLDPALLAGVVKQESNFNPLAKSGSGAKGLTQLMDSTARSLGVTDPFDAVQSLDGGARFLSGLLKQFKGNESLALAAYNAGPGAVQKYGGIPPYQETQRYVPKVLGYATQLRRIWADVSGAPTSPHQTN